jgi:hypothetical protein
VPDARVLDRSRHSEPVAHAGAPLPGQIDPCPPRRILLGAGPRGQRVMAGAVWLRYGISASARATGIARSTIGRGLKDLDDPSALSGVVRRPGSGRHALGEKEWYTPLTPESENPWAR